jgi:hypothetical protein
MREQFVMLVIPEGSGDTRHPPARLKIVRALPHIASHERNRLA